MYLEGIPSLSKHLPIYRKIQQYREAAVERCPEKNRLGDRYAG